MAPINHQEVLNVKRLIYVVILILSVSLLIGTVGVWADGGHDHNNSSKDGQVDFNIANLLELDIIGNPPGAVANEDPEGPAPSGGGPGSNLDCDFGTVDPNYNYVCEPRSDLLVKANVDWTLKVEKVSFTGPADPRDALAIYDGDPRGASTQLLGQTNVNNSALSGNHNQTVDVWYRLISANGLVNLPAAAFHVTVRFTLSTP